MESLMLLFMLDTQQHAALRMQEGRRVPIEAFERPNEEAGFN
jgi:hypothetical protein